MANRKARAALCITPIGGVVRYRNGPEELRVGDVRFLSWETLTATWAEHGFHKDPMTFLGERNVADLEPMDVVALSPIRGTAKEVVDDAPDVVTSALKLLLACNSAWGPGGTHSRPVVGLQSKRRFGFVYGEDGVAPFHCTIGGRTIGPAHEIKFDGFWNNNRKAGFYDELGNLLSSQTSTKPAWKKQLLEATSLLGHARLATNTWEAFLFSMIGLERLLKKHSREKWHLSVQPRTNALFSWLRSEVFRRRYSKGVVSLYRLRNRVAHAGQVEAVKRRDAALADEMLFNLLLVAYKHLDEVASLEELARCGELVEAQIAKGVRPLALPKASAIIAAFDFED